MDIVGNLPVELAQEILMRLSPDDLHNAWHCCMEWRYQMDDETFWKKKCRLDNFKEYEEGARSATYNKCMQHYRNYWMGLYMYSRALYSNWKNNMFKKTTVIGGNAYFALRYFDDEVAILATFDNNLVVVNSSTGEVQKLYIVDQPVFCELEKYKDLLVGHGHRSLKIWNIRSRECVFQYDSTHDILKWITVYENFVVTLNYIAILRIIDMETSKTLYKRDEVEKACFDNNILALAKLDGDIEILDINFSLMCVLKTESNIEPLHIVIKGDYLIYFARYNLDATSSSFATIWNIKTGKFLHKITPITEYISCIFLQNDKMIYGTKDNDGKPAFKFCNFVTGEVLITFHSFSDILAANNKFLFMESDLYGDVDGWCLKTGNLIIKAVTNNCLGFHMTERKFAYFDDLTMGLHILDYEYNLNYVLRVLLSKPSKQTAAIINPVLVQLSFKPPKPLIFDHNAKLNLEVFLNHLDVYLKVTGPNPRDDVTKIAVFLSYAGEEAQNKFYSFNLTEVQAKQYETVIEAFQEYCKPFTSEAQERFKFFKRVQQKDEDFDHFSTAVKCLAKECNFGELEESLIRDKIVSGVLDPSIQEELLRMPNVTLDITENYCRTLEANKYRLTEPAIRSIVKIEADDVAEEDETNEKLQIANSQCDNLTESFDAEKMILKVKMDNRDQEAEINTEEIEDTKIKLEEFSIDVNGENFESCLDEPISNYFEKRFVCATCDLSFAHRTSLIVHMKSHTAEKPYTCNVCGSKYLNSKCLKIHLRTHPRRTPFICGICGFRCHQTQKDHWDLHLKSHAGQKPFVCDTCGFKCWEKEYLNLHLKAHAFAGDICEYRCSQKEHLTLHQKNHIGDQLYSCEFCEAKFMQKKIYDRTY